MAMAAPARFCKWCGREKGSQNTIKNHDLGKEPTLPFRSAKSVECKPCFNAIGLQSGGDGSYRSWLLKECLTAEGPAAQLEKTLKWERLYDESSGGRVRVGDRGLAERAEVENSSTLELEEILGVVWPTKLAEAKLQRKAKRTELRMFVVGTTKVRGVLFPDVPGEALPPGVFRLKRGASTTVKHVQEFDNQSQALREGQVAATAKALAKRVMLCSVKEHTGKRTRSDGEEEDAPHGEDHRLEVRSQFHDAVRQLRPRVERRRPG